MENPTLPPENRQQNSSKVVPFLRDPQEVAARQAVERIRSGQTADLTPTGRFRATLESLVTLLGQAGQDQAAQDRIFKSLESNSALFRELLKVPLPQLADAVLTLPQLNALQVPEPRQLIGPVMESSLALLYAARGTGKSLFAWEIAISVASGETRLRWNVPCSAPVLIVDGEMPLTEMRKRLALQLGGRAARGNLYFLAADQVFRQSGHGINLADDDAKPQMNAVLNQIPGCKLVILDNVGSLFKGGSSGADEDTKGGNEKIADWLIELRTRGVAVLQMHHTGKSGQQRGSSYREDYQDLVMRMDAPISLNEEARAEFDLTFTKTRTKRGPEHVGFNARFDDGIWTFSELEKTRLDALLQIMEVTGKWDWKGVADEMKLSRAHVFRLRRAAIDTGKWEAKWGYK